MLCSVLHLRSIEKKGFGLCKLGHDYSICELKKHFLTQISSAIKEHPIESKYIYIYKNTFHLNFALVNINIISFQNK